MKSNRVGAGVDAGLGFFAVGFAPGFLEVASPDEHPLQISPPTSTAQQARNAGNTLPFGTRTPQVVRRWYDSGSDPNRP